MRTKYLAVFALTLVLLFSGQAQASPLGLSILPSALTVGPGDSLDLEVWFGVGDGLGGATLSSLEFNVVWDPGILIPRAGEAIPIPGSAIDLSWGPATNWDGNGAAHLAASWWPEKPLTSNLHLMTIPLQATGAGFTPVNFDFILGDDTIWILPAGGEMTEQLPVSQIAVSGSEITVNSVPLPGGLLLLGSGLGALLFKTRRRS